MTRNEARTLHLCSLMVGVTGLVYGGMRYFMEPDPESFAVVNHPWQPLMRDMHLLSAPLLVFACGLVWRLHVWLRIRSNFRPRRKTGLALALLLLPMILSGYALQVSVDELSRRIWIGTHVASSLLWLLAYVVHQLAPRMLQQAPEGPAPQSGD